LPSSMAGWRWHDRAMAVPLSELASRLIDTKAFAILATTNPDGAPQTSVIWVARDGEDLIFSTIRGRRKTRNIERDPPESVCSYAPAAPSLFREIGGTVSLVEEGGRELINSLSLAYDGVPFRIEPPEVTRLVCRVNATRVIDHDDTPAKKAQPVAGSTPA